MCTADDVSEIVRYHRRNEEHPTMKLGMKDDEFHPEEFWQQKVRSSTVAI